MKETRSIGTELKKTHIPIGTSTEIRIHKVVNLNFGKINPRTFGLPLLLFSSFYLCFCFDLLGCAFSVCRDLIETLEIICRDTTPSLTCARSRGGKLLSYFVLFLFRTGLTGRPIGLTG